MAPVLNVCSQLAQTESEQAMSERETFVRKRSSKTRS